MKDNSKARILDPDLQNVYQRLHAGMKFRAQEDYYNYIRNKHHVIMKIYHNPRCAKSRAGLKYLERKGLDVEVRKYLTDGLTEAELKAILAKTGLLPFDLVRTQDTYYKTQLKGKELTDEQWISELMKHPVLLQRPIVVNGDKAVIAHSAEEIEEIM